MDILRCSGFATKKQRSSRKPRYNITALSDRDLPFHSSPPCSDNNGSKVSPCKNSEHSSSVSRKDIKNNEGNGNLCSNGSTENKLKTLKLKVRIRTNSSSDNQISISNAKPSVASETSKPKSRLSHQDNVDHGKPSKARGNNVLQGVSSKDYNGTKDTQSRIHDHVRKGNRAPRKLALDEDEEDDDEIRYLQKMKSSKVATDSNSSKSVKVKHEVDEDFNSSSRKKMKRNDKEANDGNQDEEENTSCLTKRQRALHNGGSFIEFPDGLPPAPSRKQKLTEEEKLAKKVETAQRRKMQVEKANKESEAEAIRKILGQDSNRKKKEEKLRKQRDDLAQKKAEAAMVVASNSIRCIMGPTGNIVTFGEAIGLPSIFSKQTTSYPPPREKCAGPSCTNPYKYRDSKSNLPLCSLQCYRAVQERSKSTSC